MSDADLELLRGLCDRNPLTAASLVVLLLVGYDNVFDWVWSKTVKRWTTPPHNGGNPE